jgi:hypothetical protein
MDTVTHGAGRKLVALDRGQCLRQLSTIPVGRLIFTVDALPVVKMMNFLLVGDLIVLRMAPGTVAARKAAGSVVAFEADMVDAATGSGWSVTVTGWATLVTDAHLSTTYRSLPIMPWASADGDQFVTIKTDVLEGQQILPG